MNEKIGLRGLRGLPALVFGNSAALYYLLIIWALVALG